ncbi:MAG: sulfite exporter TauE/SafE family protein [Balneolaceae bacterium]
MSDIRKTLFKFIPFALLLLSAWMIYMQNTGSWILFEENWFMTITMIFGSFIAGASSEGGGAIAYPAMTLLFDIEPQVARNFSFAIQSVGMAFASLWIILSKIRIEKTYLLFAGLGGFLGIVMGSIYIMPFVKPDFAKMMFVSFWLSFGIALWVVNFVRKRKSINQLPNLSKSQLIELISVGFMGGVFSSVLGNGIDICTFSYVVLKYGLSEKIATPTSVILMTSNAIIGFMIHYFFLETIQPEVINYWLVSVPVVIFGAPLGAYVITHINRKTIAGILITIIVVQFFSAIFIIKPGLFLSLFSLSIFMAGILLFFVITRVDLKHSKYD